MGGLGVDMVGAPEYVPGMENFYREVVVSGKAITYRTAKTEAERFYSDESYRASLPWSEQGAADEAHAQGDIVGLCKLAAKGDQWAREILYDDYGVNDEDRAAILAHERRV